MNKKKVIFIILSIVSIIIIFFGFLQYAVSSIPFQDVQYVPASVLAGQAVKILVGKVVMLVGCGLLVGSVIGTIVTKNVKSSMDAE